MRVIYIISCSENSLRKRERIVAEHCCYNATKSYKTKHLKFLNIFADKTHTKVRGLRQI